jgi:hypothetical protein
VRTAKAVELLDARQAAAKESAVPAALLRTGVEVTDSNAVLRRRQRVRGLHCRPA